MESIEKHYDTIVIKYEKHSVNITGMFSSQFINTILKCLTNFSLTLSWVFSTSIT